MSMTKGFSIAKSIIAAMIQKVLTDLRALRTPSTSPCTALRYPPPPPPYTPQTPREQSAEQEEPANVWINGNGAPVIIKTLKQEL
jgi:hypothetical protein